jgi:hypothetical protein
MLRNTESAGVGTPFGFQLVGVNQSDEVKPVQSIARDGVVANNASPSAAMEVAPSSTREVRRACRVTWKNGAPLVNVY